jgi:uncharacterized membrane protein YfcA
LAAARICHPDAADRPINRGCGSFAAARKSGVRAGSGQGAYAQRTLVLRPASRYPRSTRKRADETMSGSLLLADPGGILVWAALVTFVAGLMRGFAGFGSAMLMAPVFAVLMGPVHMVPLIAAMEFPMGAALFVGARRDVEWGFVVPMALVAMVAMPLGIWALVTVDKAILTKVISGIVLGFVLVLVIGWRYRGPRPLALTMGIGAASGAMMATSSVGGPPVLLYMLAADHPAARIRANIIAYFFLASFVLIALVMVAAPHAVAAIVDAVVLLPVVLLGSWIGSRLAGRAADRHYRWIAYVFLTAAGVFGLIG